MATHLLDDALRDNAHVQISCTNCQTKFEPHAPAADSLTPHEPQHAEESGPIVDAQETEDTGPTPVDMAAEDMTPQPAAANTLPDLHDIWRQHDEDADSDVDSGEDGDDNSGAATAKGGNASGGNHDFPAWMHKKPPEEAADDADASVAGEGDRPSQPPVDDIVDDDLIDDELVDDELIDDVLIDDNTDAPDKTDDAADDKADDAALIEALKNDNWQDKRQDKWPDKRQDMPPANRADTTPENSDGDTDSDREIDSEYGSEYGSDEDIGPDMTPNATATTALTEDDFDDDVTFGADAGLDDELDDGPDDELDPLALPEIDGDAAQDAPETREGPTAVKSKFSPRAALSRLMAGLRRLFARRQAEPEETLLSLPPPDDDGMRVFGDDDFIDDEAFEEARRLAAVENDMRSDEPAAPDVENTEYAEFDEVDSGEVDSHAAVEAVTPGSELAFESEAESDTDAEANPDPEDLTADEPDDGLAIQENNQKNDAQNDGDREGATLAGIRTLDTSDDTTLWEPLPDEAIDEAPLDGRVPQLSETAAPVLATLPAPLAAPKRLTALSLANLVLAFVLIVLTGLNSYVLLRDRPQLNPFVDAKPVSGARISLQQAGFEILADPEGDSLIVTAQFINEGGEAGLIDDYVIYLQDGDRRSLTSWTVVGGGQTIQPGRTRQINSTLFAPPAGVTHISIEYPAGN